MGTKSTDMNSGGHDQDRDPPRTAVPPDSERKPGEAPATKDSDRDPDSDPPRTPAYQQPRKT